MKIVLTTTTLVALLAIGLLGLNNSSSGNNIGNAFAQMESGDSSMMENEAGIMGNDTAGMMNATLAYAQDDTGMMGMEDEDMMMTMSSNQSKEMEMTKLNGTIEVERTIAEAFKPKITTDIIGAIQAAQASIGGNSTVKEAKLTHAHNYLVYKITAVDENMKKYKVIVDPGNGQVLLKKDVTGCDYEHEKMKYGEEKYDQYSGHGGQI